MKRREIDTSSRPRACPASISRSYAAQALFARRDDEGGDAEQHREQTSGVTDATMTARVVKGLVKRDAVGRLTLTEDGYVVLAALSKAD
jgi:hypothetical protein